MKKLCAFFLFALPMAVADAQSAGQSAREATLAVEHATVIPMDRNIALADHTVLVAGDRILWVGPASGARIPRAAQRINGRGAYLIPGLADMHVHIESEAELAQFVAAGVTTVRNMRGAPKHLTWRDRVSRGLLTGPTIFTSGPSIRDGGGPGFVEVKTPRDADAIVRQQVAAGYDMIKVLNGLDRPSYERLLRSARAARIPVVGHVVSEIGLANSVRAGQVSIEHAYNLRQRSRLTSLFRDDQKGIAEDARAVQRAGAWVGTIASSRDGRCTPRRAEMNRHIVALRRANVKLLAGTDAGIGPVRAGASLHCELSTLVRAGLTPFEALATATVNAGAFAKQQLKRAVVPFGTVTPGARADLLLVKSDPRSNIAAVADPVAIILRGVLQDH